MEASKKKNDRKMENLFLNLYLVIYVVKQLNVSKPIPREILSDI